MKEGDALREFEKKYAEVKAEQRGINRGVERWQEIAETSWRITCENGGRLRGSGLGFGLKTSPTLSGFFKNDDNVILSDGSRRDWCNDALDKASNLTLHENYIVREKAVQLVHLLSTQNRIDGPRRVPGGLAGAIKYEAETGIRLSKNFHFQKGREAMKAIKKLMRSTTNAIDIPEEIKKELIGIMQEQYDKIKIALEIPRVKPVENNS